MVNEEYEIFSTDNDTHLLVSYNMEVVEGEKHCAADQAKSKKDNSDSEGVIMPQLVVRECIDYVRVLVLYTPSARTAVADINQTINLCIRQFHSTVYNSNITSRILIELAGAQELGFTESSDIFSDQERLIQNPTAQAIRNNTNADLVILLTNRNYSNALGNAGTLEPNEARAYAIVEINKAMGNEKVFVHEVSHLYGCRHENDNTGQPYARGYVFNRDLFTKCFTVMTSSDATRPSQSRLLNFSNPNVYISGKATGTASNNNARRVNETYTTIMGFRPQIFRPLGVYVYGPEYGQAYSTIYTWEAAVECGTAPFTYEWRTSSDGFNYSGVRGTGDKFSDRLTCPPGSYYYVRLNVRGSDGQTSYNTLSVYIDKSTCQPYITKLSDKGGIYEEQNIESIQLKDAYPNPFSSVTQIQFSLYREKTVKLEVFDNYGRKLKTLINSKLPAGVYVKSLKSLNKGVYFYRLTTDDFQQSKSLIVQ